MKVKIIASKEQLEEWSLHEDFEVGKVYEVVECEEHCILKWYKCARFGYNIPSDFVEVVSKTENRDYLRDFVKMNNIKPTLVSQALGKSRNWLTQMMNDKRRDMKEDTLQLIMKQLHIDWSSSTFLNVKATDEHTAYRTNPWNYTTDAHKLVLQRRFWDGLVR